MAERQHTLLVVDDNPDNVDMLARRLRKKGYQVLTAASGQEALSLLRSQPIDLVILDVMMPEMSGLEVVEKLRQEPQWQTLPVIMATAKGDSQDMVAALDLGANDYVVKPIDIEVLSARLRVHLRSRPQSAPLPPAAQPPLVCTEEAAAAFGPGSVFDGKYRIEARIGSGGFGAVYRARHLHLDTPVALKVVHRHLLSRPDVLRRFQREGISGFRVKHPNAVAILDAGVAAFGPYLVMEFVDGHTLEDELERHKVLSLARTAQILGPLCDALLAAHESGIIHRDIKPANIMLTRSDALKVVKVLDFGIATFIDTSADNNVTTEGFLGTPAFMAPERLLGTAIDARSDIYSVGATLYYMLTGNLPHWVLSYNPVAQALSQIHEPPVPIGEKRFDLTEEIAALIMATLAKDPAERPALSQLKSEFLAFVERASNDSAAVASQLAETGDYAPLATTQQTDPPLDLDCGQTQDLAFCVAPSAPKRSR